MKHITAIPKLRDALADPIEPENMRVIAKAYWRYLIALSVGLLACSFAYSFEQFNATIHAFDVNTPSATAKAPFSRSDLEQTVAAFDARALRYASLKAMPLSDPDPSQ